MVKNECLKTIKEFLKTNEDLKNCIKNFEYFFYKIEQFSEEYPVIQDSLAKVKEFINDTSIDFFIINSLTDSVETEFSKYIFFQED